MQDQAVRYSTHAAPAAALATEPAAAPTAIAAAESAAVQAASPFHAASPVAAAQAFPARVPRPALPEALALAATASAAPAATVTPCRRAACAHWREAGAAGSVRRQHSHATRRAGECPFGRRRPWAALALALTLGQVHGQALPVAIAAPAAALALAATAFALASAFALAAAALAVSVAAAVARGLASAAAARAADESTRSVVRRGSHGGLGGCVAKWFGDSRHGRCACLSRLAVVRAARRGTRPRDGGLRLLLLPPPGRGAASL
ncbi:hypothetical protein T492DRAFT_1064647 [Pavlovales sp. CCMP2436]|nr:hypothetical protein T492DRAFT_1064647 [Pavlovales sp. CCMP2436]